MDKIRSTQLILGLALAVAAIGCDQPGSGQLGQSGDVAEVTASLTTVPSGVLCVKLALSGSVSSSLMLTVASGASSASMSLGYVPAGNLTVTPSAFNVACSSVTSSTVPTWTGPAATVTVVAGTPLVVPLTLQPYSATATVNFVPFVKAVGASWSSSYALLSDGTVRAWGYNVDGELGDGTTTQRLTPVVVSGLSGVASLATGGLGYYSCALRTNGSVWCWGCQLLWPARQRRDDQLQRARLGGRRQSLPPGFGGLWSHVWCHDDQRRHLVLGRQFKRAVRQWHDRLVTYPDCTYGTQCQWRHR